MQPSSPEITIGDFSPILLKATIFNKDYHLPRHHSLKLRDIHDYELEYIIKSDGAMRLNNQIYPLAPGDLIFRRPGQRTQGIMPYSCYLICFDLTGSSGKSLERYDFDHQTEFQPDYHNPFLAQIPALLHPHSPAIYASLFERIMTERIDYHAGSDLLIKSLILRILYEIHQDLTGFPSTLPASPHYGRLQRCLDFIQANLATRISLQDMARVANLSPTYFHKIFCNAFETTPGAYLTQLRLKKARTLLARTSEPIHRISECCGFETTAYFSSVFKKFHHCRPLEYRNKYRYF